MIRLLPTFLAALALGGCFLSSGPYVAPAPADTPELEARVRADASDVDAVAALAALDLTRGDAANARSRLNEAAADRSTDPALPLLLAIANERLGDYGAALAQYEAYRDSHIGKLATRAYERSVSVEREALRAAVRAQLTDTLAPDGDAVAVLPFARAGSGTDDEAQAAAVAALVSEELDRAGWHTVDPTRLRLVLSEMGGSGARLPELALGVEVARILGVGTIVQGTARRVSLDQVVWDVSILRLTNPATLHVDQLVLEGGIDQLAPMLQRLSSSIRFILQGSPTDDVRLRTLSPGAILAFGRGLLAWDRGDAAEGLAAFTEATRLDPSFVEPALAATLMATIVGAPPLDELVGEVIRVGQLQRVVGGLRTAGSSYGEAMGRVGDRERSLGSDALGLDVITGDVLIDVVFPTPGGSQ